MSKLFGIFASVLLLLGLALPVHARENATSSAEATAQVLSMPVNSFDLFWPLVAGKTEGDWLYPLKLFKERIRGRFIFDGSKKAGYAVFLGTKRVLEAEKLLKDGEVKFAINSLERADSNFSYAYETIKTVGSKGKLNTSEIRRDRLINVRILIDYLKTRSPSEVHSKLDAVKEGANRILSDYLP